MRCLVRKLILGAFFVVTTVGCMGVRVAGGQAESKYQKPPQGIETLLEAPATPVASVSPDKKMMAMEQPETLSTIAEVSQPRLRVAGVRFRSETLLEAPATPVASVSPDKKMMAMEQPETLSTIAEVSQPRLRLAGLRFNPQTNGQTAVPYSSGLKLPAVSGGAPR